MKKYRVVILLVISMLLVACGNEVNEEDNKKLKVVSTFTIISDTAEQIGQDLVEVYNLFEFRDFLIYICILLLLSSILHKILKL